MMDEQREAITIKELRHELDARDERLRHWVQQIVDARFDDVVTRDELQGIRTEIHKLSLIARGNESILEDQKAAFDQMVVTFSKALGAIETQTEHLREYREDVRLFSRRLDEIKTSLDSRLNGLTGNVQMALTRVAQVEEDIHGDPHSEHDHPSIFELMHMIRADQETARQEAAARETARQIEERDRRLREDARWQELNHRIGSLEDSQAWRDNFWRRVRGVPVALWRGLRSITVRQWLLIAAALFGGTSFGAWLLSLVVN